MLVVKREELKNVVRKLEKSSKAESGENGIHVVLDAGDVVSH